MSWAAGHSNRITPLCAVATLPLGILAFTFFGLEIAAAVFVVGWLLLVPASEILFGPSAAEEPEKVKELQETARELDGVADNTESSIDPVEELRERYARGEIDEQEFERRLEALLETEDVDVDASDEAAIERVVDGLGDAEASMDERILDSETE